MLRLTGFLVGVLSFFISGCSQREASIQVPDGRYELVWRQVESSGVTIRRKSEDGSAIHQEGSFHVEISNRNGVVSGCVVSDANNSSSSVDARCRVDGSTLVILLGESSSDQDGLAFELSEIAPGLYEGSLLMRSLLIPGGKAAVADARMTELSVVPALSAVPPQE